MERTDQRKFTRHPVNIPGLVAIEATDIILRATIVDLSLGGCRLTCQQIIPPESIIAVQIRHHQIDSLSIPRALVRWNRDLSFGVQFHDLPHPQTAILTRLLWSLPALTLPGS